jgi:hypothetical protein
VSVAARLARDWTTRCRLRAGTAIDQLVFEVSVAQLRPASPMPVPRHAIVVPEQAKRRIAQSRSTLAARLSRWLSGRTEKPLPAPRRRRVLAGDVSPARLQPLL